MMIHKLSSNRNFYETSLREHNTYEPLTKL